ncbi:MAG: CheR family methyltransferase, partial [Bacteroidales bacterium]
GGRTTASSGFALHARHTGTMPEVKKVMLQSRLIKRLKALQIDNFKDYIDFVFSPKGQNEIIHMMDVVSTNKTDFFREPAHFDILKEYIIPKIIEHKSNIKIWSAACSSGEEPYTISMVLHELMFRYNFDFSILGTDISTQVLAKAVEAVYPAYKVDIIPIEMKKKYLLKSKDHDAQLVKIAKHVRDKVTFQRLNFMDESYNIPETFDIIFCRNVLIYFDKQTQEAVINKLCLKLHKGGFFFLGHSESIIGMNVPLTQVKPTVYTRI